jgi:predicted AlkP superfamily pyrophosphatase or phosphodiesterase
MNTRRTQNTWMVKLLVVVLVAGLSGGLFPAWGQSQRSGQAAAKRAQGASAGKPKLVLLIVGDQFRYDYLARFRQNYTGGLARMLKSGAVFTNAYLAHYPSVTAIGHATTMTGAYPSQTGIIGNDWFDRTTGKVVTSVSNPSLKLLGAEGTAASPHRLLVSTVCDQWKIVEPEARVVGISLKDRSAILPAGHTANGAYWYDSRSGNFVSSTHYFADLPSWVKKYNDERHVDKFAGKAWTPVAPQSRADADKPFRVMPDQPGPNLYSLIPNTPYGNDIVAQLAERAVEGEQLGQRGITDILSVSFSSNDLIGHEHGPDSPQVRDVSIRTDMVLEQFFAYLQKKVGMENTLVIFTADHGVAPVPEVLQELKMPSGRMKSAALFDPVVKALTAKWGEGNWILSTAGTSPYLNYELMAERKLDPEEVRKVAAEAMRAVPHVQRVFTRDQLLEGNMPVDDFAQRVGRSFHAQRSGDLEVLLDSFWMRSASGTTHGTPYPYDTHIPLIFMGPGIRAGRYHKNVALNDLAPTLATMLDVETPSGSVGRVLEEMLAH